MKTRITLTIDPSVSHRAKETARREGVSLSALVESLLADVSGSRVMTSKESFSSRWRGKMELGQAEDSRAQRLRKKYSLGK